jgi:hypothetical protein
MNVRSLLIALLLGGCASPVEGLWPPAAGAPSHKIHVSLDTWHAVIAFPLSPSLVPSPLNGGGKGGGGFEEWGYAERAWYLEGRQGIGGVLRALLWPTEAVVEVGHHDKVWADRTPQPPAELFTFRLSDEGFRRLHAHLRATIASQEPVVTVGTTTFYPAVDSYHAFHTCHQYAAQALRAAGLPISPFWAFTRGAFAVQLRRASGRPDGARLPPPR